MDIVLQRLEEFPLEQEWFLLQEDTTNKQHPNQKEHPVIPTEAVTEKEPSEDNVVETCAKNKPLAFLNAFFGVFIAAIFTNLFLCGSSVMKYNCGKKKVFFYLFPRRLQVKKVDVRWKLKAFVLILSLCTIGFISYTLYQYAYLRIASIFLLCSSVLLSIGYYNYIHGVCV